MSPHPYRDPPVPPPRAEVHPSSWRARLADIGAWAATHIVPWLVVMAGALVLTCTRVIDALITLDLFIASAIFLVALVLVGILVLAAVVVTVVIVVRVFMSLLQRRR